jgi:hypothetical protein
MPGAHFHPISYVAIIAPAVETEYRSDFTAEREMNIHVAVMIAIVALFTIAWLMLAEAPPGRRSLQGSTSRIASKRSTSR